MSIHTLIFLKSPHPPSCLQELCTEYLRTTVIILLDFYYLEFAIAHKCSITIFALHIYKRASSLPHNDHISLSLLDWNRRNPSFSCFANQMTKVHSATNVCVNTINCKLFHISYNAWYSFTRSNFQFKMAFHLHLATNA